MNAIFKEGRKCQWKFSPGEETSDEIEIKEESRKEIEAGERMKEMKRQRGEERERERELRRKKREIYIWAK